MDDLRSDIIDRARRLSRLRNKNHPWLTMTDEEILRSSGLILKDSEKGVDGLTLAAILLFGKDETIMAALPQHKTDAIFRTQIQTDMMTVTLLLRIYLIHLTGLWNLAKSI